MYFCFIRLASFCRECLVFPASYSCTSMVALFLPCLKYSLRPTVAALYVDYSTSISSFDVESAFRWWIPSVVSFLVFDLSSQFIFFTSWLYRNCKLGLAQLRCWVYLFLVYLVWL
jgi:hypothetical protein